MCKDNGGPTFPATREEMSIILDGMTLRDYIAIIGGKKEHKWLSEKFEEVAKENYRLRQEIAGIGVKLIDLMRAAQ